MNLLNHIKLEETDNIELLLSVLEIEVEEKVTTEHHEPDEELQNAINQPINIHNYTSQLYQAMLSMYFENCELRKKVDVLTACNELLKVHIATNVKTDDDRNPFAD